MEIIQAHYNEWDAFLTRLQEKYKGDRVGDKSQGEGESPGIGGATDEVTAFDGGAILQEVQERHAQAKATLDAAMEEVCGLATKMNTERTSRTPMDCVGRGGDQL